MNTETGLELLSALKKSASPSGPFVGLAVGHPLVAFLRPVATAKGQLNPEDVRILSEWRNRFVHSFLSEFVATEERTARWLSEILGPDDNRILFMVEEVHSGQTIGYMGLARIDWRKSSCEADAIVKGVDAYPGLIKKALLTLLDWARYQLGLRHVSLRVRSDNNAVEFYRRLGFEEVTRIRLRPVETPGMIEWVEDKSLPPGEPSVVYMALPDTP